jgi:hypothetical protein
VCISQLRALLGCRPRRVRWCHGLWRWKSTPHSRWGNALCLRGLGCSGQATKKQPFPPLCCRPQLCCGEWWPEAKQALRENFGMYCRSGQSVSFIDGTTFVLLCPCFLWSLSTNFSGYVYTENQLSVCSPVPSFTSYSQLPNGIVLREKKIWTCLCCVSLSTFFKLTL